MISKTVDLNIFVLSVLLVGMIIKFVSLLPERYYFTFSAIVDSKNPSQFLARPELPSPDSYCRSLNNGDTGDVVASSHAVEHACEIIRYFPDSP